MIGVDEERMILSYMYTWWELPLKQFLEFNGVSSINNLSSVLAFNSKECGIISLNFPQRSSFWSLRLRPDSQVPGNCKKNAGSFRRALRTELWPHCASLSPPSHYFLQRAEKNLKNQYPFQRPIEVKFYNAPANYSECVTSFFFSGRGRSAQLQVLSIRWKR